MNGEGQVALGISDGYHPGSGISQQGPLGTLGNSGSSAFYGVAFTTENDTEKVNQLQLFVPANTTTTQAHTLELVDGSSGLVVTNGSLTVPAGQVGGTSGAWITNNLPADATLAANHTYYLVAQEFNGGDSWYSDATANFGGYSMDVDNSVFNSNTLMDVYLPFGYSSAIRNSTSLDSAQFVGGGSSTGVILQSDTVIDPTSTTTPPINLKGAQLTLLDTTIRNNAGYTGPDVSVTSSGDILSAGNTFGVIGGGTYNPYLYVGAAVLDAQDNQILSLNSPAISGLAPQTLPTAPSLTSFPIIELSPTGVANTDTTNIKNAISTAKADVDSGAAGVVLICKAGGLSITPQAVSLSTPR